MMSQATGESIYISISIYIHIYNMTDFKDGVYYLDLRGCGKATIS